MQILGITGTKKVDGSRLSTHELVQQKAFVPVLLSESKCWEGIERKEVERLGSHSAVVCDDT